MRGRMEQNARMCASADGGRRSTMSDDTDRTKLERQFLSPSEIAQVTGIDVSTIRAAIKSGELPAMRLSSAANAKWRVHRADLWRWVESKKQPPAED